MLSVYICYMTHHIRCTDSWPLCVGDMTIPWLVRTWDMTHTFVYAHNRWYTGAMRCIDARLLRVGHMTHLWLICTWGMTHTYVCAYDRRHIGAIRLIDSWLLHMVTWLIRDSFVSVTWLFHTCTYTTSDTDLNALRNEVYKCTTHSYAWHDSSMTHSYVGHDLFMCVCTWQSTRTYMLSEMRCEDSRLIRMRDTTHPRLIHMRGMTHPYVYVHDRLEYSGE